MANLNKVNYVKVFAWALSVVVLLIAVFAWGQGIRWQFSSLSSYQLFPLFGLVAFSLMWTHYIVSVLRQSLGVDKKELKLYFEVTSFIVLFAIIMHPGLLEWQLWRDGLGLPPGSVLRNYVAPSVRWAALLGMVSLLVFLAYELRRWFSDRGWWRIIEIATDLAMIAILIHSLTLGTQLQHSYLRIIWYFYGVTLLASLGYIYYLRYTKPHKGNQEN